MGRPMALTKKQISFGYGKSGGEIKFIRVTDDEANRTKILIQELTNAPQGINGS